MATSGPSKPPTRSRIKSKLPWLSKSSGKRIAEVMADQPEVEHEISAANQNFSGPEDHSLWDRAWEDLEKKDPKSGYLSVLRKNFEGLQNRNTIAQDIANVVEAKQISVCGTDGISQSRTREAVAHSARFVTSTKDLVMGLSRLDPHGIAPIVLGGIYTVVQIVQNDSDERRAALSLTLDMSETVAVWQSVERYQISQNLNQNCEDLYEALSKAIVQLYQRIIVLLGTMMAYFDKGRWGKFLAAVVPAHPDWTRMQAEMKAMESNCDKMKVQIAMVKENDDRNSAVLQWISSHDIRGTYMDVLDRTQVNGRYSTRCQWFIDSREFEAWRTPGSNSVLWLNGTIGTGKTTVMARAIREMKSSVHVEIDSMPLAMFFFRKSTEDLDDFLCVDTCLRSLARQLSWNQATAHVAISAEKKYAELKSMQNADTRLASGECIDLLKDLVSQREAYIMIDGLDECKDPHALLRELSTLRHSTTRSTESFRPLHIIICGRSDIPVANYFSDCVSVVVSDQRSLEDQVFYIDSEIDDICHTQPGSLFCSPGKEYPSRLKEVLKKNAGGLFRWIEIQIDKFAKGFIRDDDQIEDELLWLEEHTSEDELNDEYARLLQNLERYDRHGRNRARAMKLLRLIACSFYPLDANDLAEAITASELADDKKEVSAEIVRRILVGFINETNAQNEVSRQSRVVAGLPFVQLAHASVLEFLMDTKSNIGGFSLASQNSEAASFAFARIRALQLAESKLPPRLIKSPPAEPSFFILYSVGRWPNHCRNALDASDGNDALLEKLVDFILRDGFEIWIDWIDPWARQDINPPDLPYQLLGFSYQILGSIPLSICTDTEPASLGFLVANFNFTELLNLPEIIARIHLQHRNRNGDSLLHFMLKNSSSSTVSRLVDLKHGEVANVPRDTLVLAARRGRIDVVEILLMKGVNIDAQDQDGDTALCAAVFSYLEVTRYGTDEHIPLKEPKALAQIIRALVAIGADIFICGQTGTSVMHLAAESGHVPLVRIILHRAIQLEAKGLRGSVQRLIRARDEFDRAPVDHTLPGVAELFVETLEAAVSRDGSHSDDTLSGVAELLAETLEAAVLRDGGIMYDFDVDYIRDIRARIADVAADRFFDVPSSIYAVLDSEAEQLRKLRRRELEQEYEAEVRKLGLRSDGLQEKRSVSEIAEVFATVRGDHEWYRQWVNGL